MRNLKRALSLALAAIMLLGMMVVGAGAVSYNDFSDRTEIVNKDAVSMLTTLGVIDGKPDGSYAPEEFVTREQMAKMISVIMNQGSDNNDLFVGVPSGLTDVAGNWALGHINYCYSLGIIAGRGDGRFDPTANVTASEAAKMLLVAAGYNPSSEGFVGADWSINVNAKASALGIFRNYTKSTMADLNRDDAALLIYNALDVEMIQKYEDGYAINFSDHRTILSAMYGVYKVEGVVVANQWAQLQDSTSPAALRAGRTTLEDVVVYSSTTNNTTVDEGVREREPVTFNVDTSEDMMGKTVTLFIEKTTILSNSKVLGVSLKDDANVLNPTSATKDTLDKFLKGTGVAADDDTAYYVNYGWCGDGTKGADEAIRIINENPNFDLDPKTGYAKFNLNGIDVEVIDNNDDGIAEYVLYTMETLSKVRAYSSRNETISLYAPDRDKDGNLNGKGASFTEDLEDVVLADGVEVTTDDLVLYVQYGGRTYVSEPEIVTGKMTRVDRDQSNELYITVEGEEYRQSFIPDAASKVDVDINHFDISKARTEVGFDTTYDFILDHTGEYVVAIRPAEEKTVNYALVLDSAWTQNALTKSGEVKVLRADGVEEKYSINWSRSRDRAFGKSDSDLEAYLGTRDVNIAESTGYYRTSMAAGTVIAYTLDDDKLLTITKVLRQNVLEDDSTNSNYGYVENAADKVSPPLSNVAHIASIGGGRDIKENLQWFLEKAYNSGDATIYLKADNEVKAIEPTPSADPKHFTDAFGKQTGDTKPANASVNYAIDRNTVAFYYTYNDSTNKADYGVAIGWQEMGTVQLPNTGTIPVQVYPVLQKNADKNLLPSKLAEVVLFNAAPVAASRDYMFVLNRNAYTASDELWLNVVFEDGTTKEIEVHDAGGYGTDFDKDDSDAYMAAYAYVLRNDGTYDIVANSQVTSGTAYLLKNGTVDWSKTNNTYWAYPNGANVWSVNDMEDASDDPEKDTFNETVVNAVLISTKQSGYELRTAWIWDTDEPVRPTTPGVADDKVESTGLGKLQLTTPKASLTEVEISDLLEKFIQELDPSSKITEISFTATDDTHGTVTGAYASGRKFSYNVTLIFLGKKGGAQDALEAGTDITVTGSITSDSEKTTTTDGNGNEITFDKVINTIDPESGEPLPGALTFKDAAVTSGNDVLVNGYATVLPGTFTIDEKAKLQINGLTVEPKATLYLSDGNLHCNTLTLKAGSVIKLDGGAGTVTTYYVVWNTLTIDFDSGALIGADGKNLSGADDELGYFEAKNGLAGAIEAASKIDTKDPKLTNSDGTATFSYIAPAGPSLDYNYVYKKLGI